MKPLAEAAPGSGTVVADLGFDDPEAELVKAKIAFVIIHEIDQRRWTGYQVSQRLQITPDVLAAVRQGRLGRVSRRALIQMRQHLNFDRPATRHRPFPLGR